MQALQHLMQRSLSAAFNSWRLVATEMRTHGHNLVLAVTRWQHSYMSSAFYTWLDWIQERYARYAYSLLIDKLVWMCSIPDACCMIIFWSMLCSKLGCQTCYKLAGVGYNMT